MNVLFVDDSRAAADALAALVLTMVHQATTAYDARSAVDLARTTTFDLILLDLDLSDTDGRKVCAAIRHEGLSQHSQIIAMTGHVGLEQDVSLGDFNGYVLKPIEFDRLEDLLVS